MQKQSTVSGLSSKGANRAEAAGAYKPKKDFPQVNPVHVPSLYPA
jgi:hypothetical protein